MTNRPTAPIPILPATDSSAACDAAKPISTLAAKIALAFSVAIPVIHLLTMGSPLPWWQRLLGAIPGIIAMQSWSGHFSKTHERRLPFLEYALTQFYVFWGLPTLTYEIVGTGNVSTYAMTEALVGVAVVVSCARLAYPLGRHLGRYLAPTVDRMLPQNAGNRALSFCPPG